MTYKSEVRGQTSEVRGQKSEVREMRLHSAKDLEVYKKAYKLAMTVFELSKGFQLRRDSR
jgi:hypothetical protein